MASNHRPVKVAHIITSLEPHGAQGVLLRLLLNMQGPDFSFHVFSLTGHGELSKKLMDAGIPVTAVRLKGSFYIFYELLKLTRSIYTFQPDVVQTWMYHSDLLGGLIAKFLGIKKVFWNVRHSDVDCPGMSWLTKSVVRTCAILSGVLPQGIICNSRRSIAIHKKIGYREEKFLFIPNGFDLDLLKPRPDSGDALRSLLGLCKTAFLVGVVARYHPQKDHIGLVRAAGIVCKENPNIHFVLVGDGVDSGNIQLTSFIEQIKVRKNVHLLGFRRDILHLTAGFDVGLSASAYGEGFSNAVGEAMASGVPCLATDVGDSSWVIGDTGVLVPPSDRNALAMAILEMANLSKGELKNLGALARSRIETHFSLDLITSNYQRLYGND